MKISVLVTTYNGEQHIKTQLDSIFKQSFPVDEVCVFDDRSSDGTVQIVNDFIQHNELGNSWKMHINNERFGIKKNFLENSKVLIGDIIFYCDQDDLWHTDKIRDMIEIYQNDSSIDVLCHNTIGFISETNKKIRRYNDVKNDGRIVKPTFESQVNYGFSPAHAMSFRKEFFQKHYEKLQKTDVPIDLAIGLLATAKKSYAIYNKTLVNHRIHNKNSSIPRTSLRNRLLSRSRQIESRNVKLKLLKNIYPELKESLSETRSKKLLKLMIKIEKDIYFLENNKRLKLIFNNLFCTRMDIQHSYVNLIQAVFSRNNDGNENE